MSPNAFGVDHGDDISKHYLGHHKREGSAHERSEHGDLRRAKNAAARAYNDASQRAFDEARDAYAKAHPFAHSAEKAMRSYAQNNPDSIGAAFAPRGLTADRKGHEASERWAKSKKGKRAQSAAERAKGKWNPRYEKRRKAEVDARRAAGISKAKKDRKEAAAYVGGGAIAGGAAGAYLDNARQPGRRFQEPKPKLRLNESHPEQNFLHQAEYGDQMRGWSQRAEAWKANNEAFEGLMRENKMGRKMARGHVAEGVRSPGKGVRAVGRHLKSRRALTLAGTGAGALYGGAVYADVKERRKKGKIAKADWKTIDQRETAQRRNRRHAAQVTAAGSIAAGTGLAAMGSDRKTAAQVNNMYSRGVWTYKQSKLNRMDPSIWHTKRKVKNGEEVFISREPQGKYGASAGAAVDAVKRAWREPAPRGKLALGAVIGGVGAGAAATAVAGSRNKYHQHKINQRRRANHKKRTVMAKSAFGVEHGDSISKAAPTKPKTQKPASAGRQAAGTLFPGWHGAFAGKKGHKLRAAGNELGGRIGGALVGQAAAAPLVAGGLAHATRPAGMAALAGGTGISVASTLYGGVKGTQRAQRMGHYKPER